MKKERKKKEERRRRRKRKKKKEEEEERERRRRRKKERRKKKKEEEEKEEERRRRKKKKKKKEEEEEEEDASSSMVAGFHSLPYGNISPLLVGCIPAMMMEDTVDLPEPFSPIGPRNFTGFDNKIHMGQCDRHAEVFAKVFYFDQRSRLSVPYRPPPFSELPFIRRPLRRSLYIL